MKNADKGNVWIFLIVLSAVFSYLVIILEHFPYLGISISLAVLSSLVFFFKGSKSNFNLSLYLLTLVFSFFIFLRANEFLTLLNILSVFFLGSLMALTQKDKNNFGFLNFLISPLVLFFNSLKTKSNYVLSLKPLSNVDNAKIKKERVVETVKSFIVSFAILLVIIPLLASANPFFNKLVSDFIEIFSLQTLFKKLLSVDNFVWLIRIGVFLILGFFIPRLLTYINTSSDKHKKIPSILDTFCLLMPKILVGFVICIFFITQAQLYFATGETLQSLGLTHSQYAREVFAQLSIVSLVILGLIYNDKSKKILPRILTYILVLEGVFLTFIALKSVYDYSSNWGFTYKRLWGYTGVFWILGVLGFFLYKYLRDTKNIYFVKGVILFSGLVLIVVNIANFDSLIFHHKKSITHRGIDHMYLSGLSSDAQSYKQHFQILEDKMKNIDKSSKEFNTVESAALRLLKKIDRLQRKYNKTDLRTLNLSEYLQYQNIKSVDTKKYCKILESYPSPSFQKGTQP